MYDKLKIWVDKGIVGEQITTISGCLADVRSVTDHQTGEMREYGKLDSLSVSVYSNGLSIVGSLAKYHHSDNLFTLNRQTTQEAITDIGDRLRVDLRAAKVTSLEFGTHFIMCNPVPEYLALLGEVPYLKRCRYTDNTLYYRSKGKREYKVHTFYDKAEETQTRGVKLPPTLTGANLLRYELRYNNKLSQQLNTKEVTAAMLYDERFYRSMLQRYSDVYFSINKTNVLKTDIMSEIKTVGDAFEVVIARLINQAGHEEIDTFLSELKQAKVFDHPIYYTRLKKKLKDVAGKVSLTETNELINELDEKIRSVVLQE